MWLDKLKTSIRPKTNEHHAVHLMRAVGDFEQELQQERRAADLSGHEFSLLIFEFDGSKAEADLAHKLGQIVHRRVRRTDKFGWLSQQSLGLILPDTPFSGGRKVAEDICRMLEAALPAVSYKILIYPPRHELA